MSRFDEVEADSGNKRKALSEWDSNSQMTRVSQSKGRKTRRPRFNDGRNGDAETPSNDNATLAVKKRTLVTRNRSAGRMNLTEKKSALSKVKKEFGKSRSSQVPSSRKSENNCPQKFSKRKSSEPKGDTEPQKFTRRRSRGKLSAVSKNNRNAAEQGLGGNSRSTGEDNDSKDMPRENRSIRYPERNDTKRDSDVWRFSSSEEEDDDSESGSDSDDAASSIYDSDNEERAIPGKHSPAILNLKTLKSRSRAHDKIAKENDSLRLNAGFDQNSKRLNEQINTTISKHKDETQSKKRKYKKRANTDSKTYGRNKATFSESQASELERLRAMFDEVDQFNLKVKKK